MYSLASFPPPLDFPSICDITAVIKTQLCIARRSFIHVTHHPCVSRSLRQEVFKIRLFASLLFVITLFFSVKAVDQLSLAKHNIIHNRQSLLWDDRCHDDLSALAVGYLGEGGSLP